MWLLFWPCYLLRYILLERYVPARGYVVIYSFLDEWIPFCEWFLIPYVLWYGLLIGTHLYLLFHDRKGFRMYSRFLTVATAIATGIFLLYPSCQQLRPEAFDRDNMLTALVGILYGLDTNTNVLPSEHVIGAVAVILAVTDLQGTGKWLVVILSALSGIATVFLKQHSVLDVVAAVPVCAVAWKLSFGRGVGAYGRKQSYHHTQSAEFGPIAVDPHDRTMLPPG